MRFLGLLAIVSCGKSDAPAKPAVAENAAPQDEARTPPAENPMPSPPAPAAFTLPAVDRSHWQRTQLSKLGKAKLPFDGVILLPPGAKTKVDELHTSDGKSAGQMAFVTLPDHVEVMLGIRSSISQKDPTMLKQLFAAQGPFLIDREGPDGYMFVQKRDDGYVIQGASWPVEPGLDCATRDALTLDQLAETLAICDSFCAK
jgi:hypothetical protein